MSSNNKEYFIIFDTNVLFQRYESKADFSSFSFNSTYDNVVNMINQLDIYESVKLVIPSVVWREMEKQIIEKHDERIVAFKNTIEKIQFPEFSISENLLEEYSVFIKGKIEEYKVELSNGINNVIEMNIATNQRFDSIVDRAFEKKPPFEGKIKSRIKDLKMHYFGKVFLNLCLLIKKLHMFFIRKTAFLKIMKIF